MESLITEYNKHLNFLSNYLKTPIDSLIQYIIPNNNNDIYLIHTEIEYDFIIYYNYISVSCSKFKYEIRDSYTVIFLYYNESYSKHLEYKLCDKYKYYQFKKKHIQIYGDEFIELTDFNTGFFYRGFIIYPITINNINKKLIDEKYYPIRYKYCKFEYFIINMFIYYKKYIFYEHNLQFKKLHSCSFYTIKIIIFVNI